MMKKGLLMLVLVASIEANSIKIMNYATKPIAVNISWYNITAKQQVIVSPNKVATASSNDCVQSISFWKDFTLPAPKWGSTTMPQATGGVMVGNELTFKAKDCPAQFIIDSNYKVTVLGKYKGSVTRGQSYKKPGEAE